MQTVNHAADWRERTKEEEEEENNKFLQYYLHAMHKQTNKQNAWNNYVNRMFVKSV